MTRNKLIENRVKCSSNIYLHFIRINHRNFYSYSMIQSYINKLKYLQDDRTKFERQTNKTNLYTKMNQQQSKYQAYIIDQMNEKNQLIAVVKLESILAKRLKETYSDAMKSFLKLKSTAFLDNVKTSKETAIEQCFTSSFEREETTTVNFHLVKLSLDVIKRISGKYLSFQVKNSFSYIKKRGKDAKKIQKLSQNMQKYHYRHSFKAIEHHSMRPEHQQTNNKLFDQSFSVIYKNEKMNQKRCHMMELSYLSGILDKENIECDRGKQNVQQGHILELKEQLSFLKTLLAERTLELKKKVEQCQKIRQKYQEFISGGQDKIRNQNYSEIHSKNSSFYSEIEKYVLGGKRIRKNGGNRKNSSSMMSNREELLSNELLNKYMRQSFQMKENMDMARDLSFQMMRKLKPELKAQMLQIIKCLNNNGNQQEVSMIDDEM